jgi:hypothetical protein
VDESFFALGGHSLSAMQVVARIGSLFQVHLSLRSLFERPPIEATAESMAEELGGADVLEKVALSILEASSV